MYQIGFFDVIITVELILNSSFTHLINWSTNPINQSINRLTGWPANWLINWRS